MKKLFLPFVILSLLSAIGMVYFHTYRSNLEVTCDVGTWTDTDIAPSVPITITMTRTIWRDSIGRCFEMMASRSEGFGQVSESKGVLRWVKDGNGIRMVVVSKKTGPGIRFP